jgi:hypothetical protein
MTTLEALETLSIRERFTLLLDERQLERHQCLTVTDGLVRVAASRFAEDSLEAHPVTLGFLQAGDQLPLDLLRNKRLHLQALRPTQLVASLPSLPAADGNSLHDWTLEMLLIRNLSDAEQRIGALLQLLVGRLGRRHGAWYELLLPLTHAELAELCGHTRVTVTRQFSRWRDQGLLKQEGRQHLLRLSPALVEAAAGGFSGVETAGSVNAAAERIARQRPWG